MHWFTSDRERRLWFAALAVIIAIYSTLGPARTLADALRERNLLRLSFALAVLLVVAASAARWLRRRPEWDELVVALGVALAYLVAFLRMASTEERTHLIEYGIVAALIHEALRERVRHGRRVAAPAGFAVAVTGLLGLLDEGIQALLPSRVYDPRDVAFNIFAGVMAVVAGLALARPRRPGWRLWFLWMMAGALGWGIGMELGFLGQPGGLRKLLSEHPDDVRAGFLSLAGGATLSGTLQWLVLRRRIARVRGWFWACVGAVAIAGAVVFGAGSVDMDLGWRLGAGLFGIAAGIMQWMVLRRWVPQAGWWVAACAAGWLAGIPSGETFGWLALGAVYGGVTGAALVWLTSFEDLRLETSQPGF